MSENPKLTDTVPYIEYARVCEALYRTQVKMFDLQAEAAYRPHYEKMVEAQAKAREWELKLADLEKQEREAK